MTSRLAVPLLLSILLLPVLPFPAACSAIIHVRADGDDCFDGLSWTTAKRTVQVGIDAASAGDEVWVAAGTYVCTITLKDGVGLYGGFAGDEGAREAREWKANVTTLDAGGAGSVVTVTDGAALDTVIDGFTICNGFLYWTPSDSPPDENLDAVAPLESWRMEYSGAGVYCAGSATISNNTIRENQAGYAGGGIYCEPGTSPRIVHNLIIGNYADVGAGVFCCGSGMISNNEIAWNDAGNGGGGVFCASGSSPIVSGNHVTGNYGGYYQGWGAGAIYCGQDSTATISANTIAENEGEGIFCELSSPTIANNTITANDPGIYCYSASPVISNNIVAFNATGIANLGDGVPTLRNNDIYNPDGTDYSGLTPGTGDISADPVFARLGIGDFHIQPDSPCRNAGWNDASRTGTTDMDGQPRIQGGVVDIGADESDGTAYTYAPVTVRVSTEGDDANDGSSWALAKKTVQSAINAAGPTGGEVWVKAGEYRERVDVLPYVSIYGGFTGTENDRSQRNWAANKTVLDGDSNWIVVSASFASYYRFSPSAIDGFTIRNGRGYYGAGVWCSGPITVANNLITGMKTDYGGGAVYSSGYATISNNTVFCNDAGSGIRCDGHTQTVTNNTIVLNAGSGINCYNSRTSAFNNIVAFNSSGIYKPAAPGVSFSNNLVYNPGGYDYSDGIRGAYDISHDPKLVLPQGGVPHILPDSPCRDAGWNEAPGIGTADVDHQARIQGGRIDVGADESDGTAWPAPPQAVRVSPDGEDANDGSSWSLAKRTLQAAIGVAPLGGGEIWVKQGTYSERIRLATCVRLYGGFAGTEDTRSARDWIAHETILDGGQGGSVVTVTANSGTIDGFTIRNGRADSGGGVYCGQRTSPTISNNRITGNTATRDGGGVSASFNARPLISGNVVSANTALSNGGGIHCEGPASIVGNRVLGNSGYCAVFSEFDSPTISNNVIAGNTGAGARVYGGSPAISNNTITGNSGAAIAASDSAAMISNNIVAWNASGLFSDDGGPATLRNNCVYNPSGANYVRLTPGPGDIAADPRFVDMAGGNLHLRPDSPCIDAGWYYAPGAGMTDFDGRPRIQNHAIDIGAYESDGPAGPVEPVVVVRVDGANGSDANDGSNWASAKKTVQSAIDTAAILGGEVWVKAGVYCERITLKTYVRLYGGFSGTESAVPERNWNANVTVLDGGRGGSVVTVASPSNPLTRIDGLTIRNGEAVDGGGIYCPGCAVISNNTISANRAANRGGGVYCGDQALLLCNTIAENSAVSGGGIFCTGWTRVTNNTIVGNSASSGGGINSPSTSTDIFCSIIAFNSSGVSGTGGGPELIRNNVYNPAGANYKDTSYGSSDISADPLFADLAAGDYHLTTASPCINAGWDYNPDLPGLDLDGEPRRNGLVDIGADEYWPPVAAIAACKLVSGGLRVDIDGVTVSAAFPGFFYIESDDRACGIRVDCPEHALQTGARVHVAGALSISPDGERCIAATSVLPDGTGTILPLALSNPALGGGSFGSQGGVWGWKRVIGDDRKPRRVWGEIGGLNNIGLLVRIWGRVTAANASTFAIDDGSGEAVECRMPPGVTPDPSWHYVSVTGISSCKRVGEEIHRLLRVRSQQDVVRIY